MSGTRQRLVACAGAAMLAVWVGVAASAGGAQPTGEYVAYVASEAADTIARLRFGRSGLVVEKEFPTGVMPTDVDGPHGLALSPDGRSYFVSLAHGQPNGSLWKYSTADDSVLGRVTLGMFPATMQVTPDGEFVYVVNFNVHGDPVPSSVSVVATGPMLEVARIVTCAMPHGSRFNPSGTRHYSACMMDDVLVEIDTSTMKVSRHFVLTAGREVGHRGPPAVSAATRPTAHAGGHGSEPPPTGSAACSPTWAQPSADGRRVFVACNGTSEIIDIDINIDIHNWKAPRRIPAGQGVYNLAVSRNGKLVATNRRDRSVSVFDVVSGRELDRVATKRRVVHGAAITADDRYAFISVEGVGAEPGTVEVLDLTSLKMVASVDVAPQAGGIDVVR